MKAYKYILFLLFFGLLTLQQVHADNVGKLFQTGNTSKSCDIYYKISADQEIFVELKNVDFSNINDLSVLNTGTISMQRINQVIGANGAFSRITNLNQYQWVATSLKNNDLNHLKQLWKKAFIENETTAFQTIWNNTELRGSLFGNRTEQLARNYFNTLINNENSIIFNFIKIE